MESSHRIQSHCIDSLSLSHDFNLNTHIHARTHTHMPVTRSTGFIHTDTDSYIGTSHSFRIQIPMFSVFTDNSKRKISAEYQWIVVYFFYWTSRERFVRLSIYIQCACISICLPVCICLTRNKSQMFSFSSIKRVCSGIWVYNCGPNLFEIEKTHRIHLSPCEPFLPRQQQKRRRFSSQVRIECHLWILW